MPGSGHERGSWPLPLVLVLAGLVLVGLAFRLPSLDDAFYGDELSTYFVVHGFGLGGVLELVDSDQEATPPLFYLLAWVVKDLGDPAASIRVPSLLAGVAAIPLTYLLGRWTVGSRAGLVGATLVTASPFLIYYSTEARAYALALVLALCSTLSLLRALDTSRTRWWVLYAILSAACVYTHYTAIFVLGGQLAWAFVAEPGARRSLLLANLAAAVLFVPWIPGFLNDQGSPGAVLIQILAPFNLSVLRTELVDWSVAGPVSQARTMPGTLALWLIAAGAAAAAAGLALRLRGPPGSWWPPPSRLLLILILAASAPLVAAAYSSFADSVFVARNLIVSWPALAVAAGAFLTATGGVTRVVAVSLVLAGFAIGAVKLLDSDYQRPAYDEVAAFIEESGQPGDPIVEFPAPFPGPQTALEATVAEPGEPYPEEFPVLVLQYGSLEARLSSRGPGGAGPLAQLPIPDPEAVARRAARLAQGGRLFLVLPGEDTLEQLRDNVLLPPIAEFVRALPPWLREVESRTFPGFSIFPLTVHVLEDAGAREFPLPGPATRDQ